MNNLALETLKILRGELNDHAVKTNIELASELPLIMGHRVQLQEVILNLVRNAIDAMDSNARGSPNAKSEDWAQWRPRQLSWK